MSDTERVISIIVPVFQAEATLRDCLEALLGQTIPAERYEILLVDNNSTDRSVAIAEAFPEVKLLRETEQSAYAARNRGVAEARGRILAFTDPDCVPREDWLAELTAPFAADEVQVVLGRTRFGQRRAILDDLEAYESLRNEEIFAGDDPLLYYGRTNNSAVRAEVFETLGPLEVRARGSDTILVRRVVDRSSCSAAVYATRAEVVHREVTNLGDWYRKLFTYGRSSASYGQVIPAAVPGRSLRRRVFRRLKSEKRLSWPRRCRLTLLLAIGKLVWSAGARRGKR